MQCFPFLYAVTPWCITSLVLYGNLETTEVSGEAQKKSGLMGGTELFTRCTRANGLRLDILHCFVFEGCLAHSLPNTLFSGLSF